MKDLHLILGINFLYPVIPIMIIRDEYWPQIKQITQIS